jgi:hypothetical protein
MILTIPWTGQYLGTWWINLFQVSNANIRRARTSFWHSVRQNRAASLLPGSIRPYRMQLPASLRWIEVDLPDMLNYKQEVLAAECPVCTVDGVPLDLRDSAARRELFQRLGEEAKRVLVVSEGLSIYFEADGVAEVARSVRPVQFPALGHPSTHR